MSQKSVETIIGKVVLDTSFRATLLADPDQALAGFALTRAEKASLKRMDAETLDALANTLVARASRLRVQNIFADHSLT